MYEYQSVQSLRRELERNGQLRDLCGFDAEKGIKAVPGSWVYSRFLRNLMKHEEEIEMMFDEIVEKIKEELPDYGKYLVVDGKAVSTHANGEKRGEGKKEADGRRDVDAEWGDEGVPRGEGGWDSVGGSEEVVWVQAAFSSGCDL